MIPSQIHIAVAFDPAQAQPHPQHIQYNAIWDTGASGTVITRKVVGDLGLKPITMKQVSTASGIEMSNVYLVNVLLPNKVGFSNIHVTEGKLTGIDALIGMDIISNGDFSISNYQGITTFSFRVPSCACIDFVEQSKAAQTYVAPPKIGRNDHCPCGSGKKYKNCCLGK
jgi:predicted aspartyl protease